jgi:NADH pyrophosphatase NudC (nudix superfamily)
MDKYKFCPNCKSELTATADKVLCTRCGFLHYFDPSPTVGVMPIKDGKILLSVRKVEPFKGELDLIGGFVKSGESAEEAAIRETTEETGLNVEIVRFFKSYADIYGDSSKPVLGIDFIVNIIGGEEKAADDVADLKWIPIKDIPKLKLNTFENVKTALMELFDQTKKVS